MSLFPTCRFELLLQEGTLVAGTTHHAYLRVVAPVAIERAEHLFISFHTEAVAGYGSGKNRSVVSRTIFVMPFKVDIPPGGFPAGDYRYPIALNVPEWLPPNFTGPDCHVRTHADVRLGVDWAVDPTASFPVPVRPGPRSGVRTPVSIRSPRGFHQAVTLEVSMPSSSLLVDEAVSGTVLLRSGRDSKFDAVVLCLELAARVRMGNDDVRVTDLARVRISKEALLSGAPVPFLFPSLGGATTALNHWISLEPRLSVSLDVPWAFDPQFSVPLDVYPIGSELRDPAALGGLSVDRLARVAAEVAEATGLTPGRPPCLVAGSVGMVRFAVFDSPEGGRMGALGSFSFPDLDLALDFHPIGLLEGFRGENLLPPGLARRYVVRSHEQRLPRSLLEAFFARVLQGLEDHLEFHMTDHDMRIRGEIPQDDTRTFVAFTEAVREKARLLDIAIRELPFPAALTGAEAAWVSCARAEGATLVPHRPAIIGAQRVVRLALGEPRVFDVSLSTHWRKSGPTTRLDLSLGDLELPKNAADALGATPLPAVRARFSSVTFGVGGHLVAEGDGVTRTPADLMPAADALIDFLLDLRGDRRNEGPYR